MYIFFDEKERSIKLHFDIHHGHGNLDKAIRLLPEQDYARQGSQISENISARGTIPGLEVI